MRGFDKICDNLLCLWHFAKWDSDLLGIKCGKINKVLFNCVDNSRKKYLNELFYEVLTKAQAEDFEDIFCRTDPEFSIINSCENNKFRTIGIHLDFIQSLDKNFKRASVEDWKTEYLDKIISVKIVDGVNEAIEHINNFSSNHTESIITENKETFKTFYNNINSAIILQNASTQFADGGEFGFGAEIGISTDKLHVRGPVGAEHLTSFKYVVRGNGQIRP